MEHKHYWKMDAHSTAGFYLGYCVCGATRKDSVAPSLNVWNISEFKKPGQWKKFNKALSEIDEEINIAEELTVDLSHNNARSLALAHALVRGRLLR